MRLGQTYMYLNENFWVYVTWLPSLSHCLPSLLPSFPPFFPSSFLPFLLPFLLPSFPPSFPLTLLPSFPSFSLLFSLPPLHLSLKRASHKMNSISSLTLLFLLCTPSCHLWALCWPWSSLSSTYTSEKKSEQSFCVLIIQRKINQPFYFLII